MSLKLLLLTTFIYEGEKPVIIKGILLKYCQQLPRLTTTACVQNSSAHGNRNSKCNKSWLVSDSTECESVSTSMNSMNCHNVIKKSILNETKTVIFLSIYISGKNLFSFDRSENPVCPNDRQSIQAEGGVSILSHFSRF